MILPVIVALVMMVLSNNIVYAFGLMAVFAIVRFRNILRDTLDTTYVLGVIVVGMACGTFKFMTAMIGCLLICSILLYLWMTGFGNRQRFDVILNLHWAKEINQIQELGRPPQASCHPIHLCQLAKAITGRTGEMIYPTAF